MLCKIKEYVTEHEMFRRGDKVILGLSGGADSVCLFFVLMELQKEYDIRLEAVHIHHGIRDKEADEDAGFVQTLCEQYQIPVRVIYRDVPAVAGERHLSEEAAGRNIRYEEFRRILKEEGAQKIAVAHHACDQAETILYHLCRGSGLRGLCGMQPVTGEIVRPLLCIQRTEIEAFLTEREIAWRTDSSNLLDVYMRNRIRNQVMPLLESAVNRKSITHIAQSGDMFLEAYSYIRKQGGEAYTRIAIRGQESTILDEKLLQKEDVVIQKEVIRMALEEYAEGLKDITKIHIQSILDLLNKPVGKAFTLPGDIQAVKTYGKLVIAHKKRIEHKKADMEQADETALQKGFSIPLEPGMSYRIPGSEMELALYFTSECPFSGKKSRTENAMRHSGEKFRKNEENSYTKWMDYDRIKGTLQLRHRKEGDYIVLEGSGGRKKLKQYFIDEKIPREVRDSIWLLADGSHVLWVLGYRMSAGCRVTEETNRILRVRLMEATGNGR